MLWGDDGAFKVLWLAVVAVLVGRDSSGRVRELAPLSDSRCFGIARSDSKSSRTRGAGVVEGSCSEWDEAESVGREVEEEEEEE